MARETLTLKEIMAGGVLQGATEGSRQIEITAKTTGTLIVYVQPNGNGPEIISFREFADVVRRRDDPVSQRFAVSLCEWAEIQAGEKTANQASQFTSLRAETER